MLTKLLIINVITAVFVSVFVISVLSLLYFMIT